MTPCLESWTTATSGISALQLQRQLGLKRYETSWTILHKLRRAMVNPEREPLTGVVEVDESIAAGAIVRTDGRSGYKRLARLGFDHQPRSQRAHHLLGEDPDGILPRVHRVISHLKTWLQDTHRGVSDEYLQVYLEFTFRFNRRRTPMAAFQRVLGLGSQQEPTTHEEILAEGPAAARRAAELNG